MQRINKNHEESGEIMLESSIVLVAVIVLVMALFSISFLFYQKWMMVSIASEIASDIAENYKFIHQEMGDPVISIPNDSENAPIFRMSLGKNKVENAHEERAEEYLVGRILLTTLGFNSEDPQLTECHVEISGIGRAYIVVTVEQKTDFFLSEFLEYLGIWGDNGVLRATAKAECVDLSAYTSMINFADYFSGELSAFEPFGTAYTSIKELIQKIDDLLN